LKQTANKEGLRGKSVLSLRRVCRKDRKSSGLLSTELFSIVCRQKETAAFSILRQSRFLLDIKIEISRNALDEDVSVAGRLFKKKLSEMRG
jgi:hypothetical protein